VCYQRAIGCVLGAFIGDAAGATLEFIGQENITEKSVKTAMMLKGGGVFNVGPGQITDDSEMALCLLTAAHENVECLDLNLI
jgi:ADP-ribosylglycohydrolase